MVPRITSKGKSFKGAGAYFLHDLGKAKTSERVAFTHTVNMLTDDPEKAVKVMAWTAAHANDLKHIAGQKQTGRKAENPVYTYVLSWAPDQNPDQAHMVEFGLRSLKTLGLDEHEALFIAHNDTDHKHVHIMVNRVHPVTGIMANMGHDKNLLSRLAQTYEQETGRVYCLERVANNRARDVGDKHVKDRSSQPVTEQVDYQQRRAERIAAQRKAAVWHAQKAKEQDNKTTRARDLQAAFDGAAARDDGQYRAKELTRPEDDERQQAAQAWADEQVKERARLKDERERLKAQKRADEWAQYEDRQWSSFYEKQTARREGLRDKQAQAVHQFERRLAQKYGPAESLTQAKIDSLTNDLQAKGLMGASGLLAKVLGHHARHVAQLDALHRQRDSLERQRQAERATYAAKQQAQREKQARAQEAERLRKVDTLQATKARQDALFLRREEERRRQWSQNRVSRFNDPQKQQETEAQRAAVREDIHQKEQARAQRAAQADKKWADYAKIDPSLQLGDGLSRDYGRDFSR
jgi:hypothetical protein